MPNTFKRNTLIGFGFSLILLIISSTASFISIRMLISSSRWVEHTNIILTDLESINASLVEAESSQRGYILSGSDDFLYSYRSSVEKVHEQISDIAQMTADNASQQQLLLKLSTSVDQRLQALATGITMKQQEQLVSNSFLIRGKEFMNTAQGIINQMEQIERKLLDVRTKSQQQFSTLTPVIIVVAGLISLLITLVFYSRIVKDYLRQAELRKQLETKDLEISKRLTIIQNIADKISSGNYSARIGDEGRDILGSLAGSLNKMGESLHYSFGLLSDKEWLQAGVAGLNEQMLGEKNVEALSDHILDFVVAYTNSKVGAVYLANDAQELKLSSRFALTRDAAKTLHPGEGIAGQCALSKKILTLDNVPEKDFYISFASGSLKPSSVTAVPILHEGNLKGVIELGALRSYSEREYLFLDAVSSMAGIAVDRSQNRRRLQELLEETQAQSEELQTQHSELENINEELKSQSQKLQVSEEELKVQQEELMQTNTELEERTTLLEEKNQTIEERNQDIQMKASELEQSTKYKSEFLANMSHELRTPLNSILLLSRLMVDNNQENLSSEQIEYAQVIQNSGQSLLSLIDEILDLSHIESGKMEMDYQALSLRQLTNDLKSLFAPVAKEKNISFSIDIHADIPDYIETDKMRLDQILKNLISNAIKFTSKGAVQLDISKNASTPSQLVFAVKDTGIGISSDKQKLIFEAFQQADGSTRRQYGGTGLGLSISRELARLLGGSIELTSVAGEGSEFRLLVPASKPAFIQWEPAREIKRVPEPEAYNTLEEVLVTEDNTTDKMSEVFHRIEDVLKKEPRKVLIIEENPKHARALSYFLENFNINAEIKEDVEESIESLQRKEVNVVILDTGIAHIKTYENLEKIKSTPGLELLPIIVFTGKSLSKTEESRLKQYVNSIVIKTAHSYQRILDEVSLFLHTGTPASSYKKLGRLTEVLKNKKVLIADDDVRNIFSLSKALESFGMNILSATDGNDALQQLKEGSSIDIILMDMMMPEMDGYETMKTIRSIPGFGKLPIIAVTAKAMAGDREKCISAGASDYITKPIDKDQLLSLLRVWLYDRS